MVDAYWQKIEQIFNRASELPAADRTDFLNDSCEGDDQLQREISALLAKDEESDIFLDTSIRGSGLEILAKNTQTEFSLENQIIGTYKVMQKLGSGGMGDVYLAEDMRLKRFAAFKVLTPSYSSDQEYLIRFQEEARAASAIAHPGIAHIYEFDVVGDVHYLAMEYVEGETLRQLLEREKLGVEQIVKIAKQIADALSAAHARGIIHRDIKPENIMLADGLRVKILDFGLAKRIKLPGINRAQTTINEPFKTETGFLMGTTTYMSPEQIRSAEIDHRTDIWNLGILLYEMMSGHPPFHKSTPIETLSSILKEELAISGKFDKELEGLSRIIDRCLAKNPDDRYQSASEVKIALKDFHQPQTDQSKYLATSPTSTNSMLQKFFIFLLPVVLIILVLFAFKLISFQNKLNSVVPVANAAITQNFLPVYNQETFQRGTVWSARFAPDENSFVYSATWGGGKLNLFSTRSGMREARTLNLPDTNLLSISSKGEMALLITKQYLYQFIHRGTLARMPLNGEIPREVTEDVQEADWSPDAENLAIVRWVNGHNRLEYPVGNVLYETSGYIANIRVSPDGNVVAFADHPKQWDNRGFVATVDRSGQKKTLSRELSGLEGLAWNPASGEIWFTASQKGEAYALYAAQMNGDTRFVARTPINLMIYDISSSGKVLLSRAIQETDVFGKTAEQKNEKNLSWLQLVGISALSVDGKTVLFTHFGEGSGTNYTVYARTTDGLPAVKLGDGRALALSPDGKFAIAKLNIPEQLNILPLKAGEIRTMPRGNIEHYDKAGWFPDGQQILFTGNEPNSDKRCFAQDLETGAIRPLTPEGITGNLISPSGKQLVVSNPQGEKLLYEISNGKIEKIKNLEAADEVIGWGRDDESLYLFRAPEIPIKIYQLQLLTGRKTLIKEIIPSDPSGIFGKPYVFITPDAGTYVYGLRRYLFNLYTAENFSSVTSLNY